MATQREEVIQHKKLIVTELIKNIEQSDALFITEYSGLTVKQLQDLRTSLRESNAVYKVIKNSLTLRAFADLNLDLEINVLDILLLITIILEAL